MIKNKKLLTSIFSVVILLSGAQGQASGSNSVLGNITFAAKRNINPCWASNCQTPEDLIFCLRKKTEFSKFYNTGRFFAKFRGEGNERLDKERQVIKYIPNPKVPGEFVEKTEMVKLIDQRAFKAFLEGIERNPLCFREFCRTSCMLREDFDKKEIKAHMQKIKKNFSNVIYERLTINKETGQTEIVREAFTPAEIRDMNEEELYETAYHHLQYIKNQEVSRFCSKQDEDGRMQRMMCSRCYSVKAKGALNPACSDFNSEVEVDQNKTFTESEIEGEAQLKLGELETRRGEIMQADEQYPDARGIDSLLNYPITIPTPLINFAKGAYGVAKRVVGPHLERGRQAVVQYGREVGQRVEEYAQQGVDRGVQYVGQRAEEGVRYVERRAAAGAQAAAQHAERRVNEAGQHIDRHVQRYMGHQHLPD